MADKDTDSYGSSLVLNDRYSEPEEETFGSENRHSRPYSISLPPLPFYGRSLHADSGYVDIPSFNEEVPSARPTIMRDQYLRRPDYVPVQNAQVQPEQESTIDEFTSLFQKYEKKLERVRHEKYNDAVLKDTFQRDIELLKSKVAELETHNRNNDEKKLHEEIDGFTSMLRKISEKIDDMSHKADEREKTIIEFLSQKVDELQLAAKNVISEYGRKSSCTMEGVDSSTQYEAEFKSGHLGIIKGIIKWVVGTDGLFHAPY